MGAMLVSDEIDALEVMGFNSMTYLVATRVRATIMYIPFIFLTFTGLAYLVYYLLNVQYFESYSYGAFLDVHFGFITWLDALAQIWHMYITGLIIVLTSCYYGFNARRGPVGAGRNTAKSMIINLAVISSVSGDQSVLLQRLRSSSAYRAVSRVVGRGSGVGRCRGMRIR
jgi:phospholipid/cholesterol/gamma-HCH transport system permease protein